MILPDSGVLNNQAAMLILRLNYVKNPGGIISLTDISENVWINTTLINTNISKVDDLRCKNETWFGRVMIQSGLLASLWNRELNFCASVPSSL